MPVVVSLGVDRAMVMKCDAAVIAMKLGAVLAAAVVVSGALVGVGPSAEAVSASTVHWHGGPQNFSGPDAPSGDYGFSANGAWLATVKVPSGCYAHPAKGGKPGFVSGVVFGPPYRHGDPTYHAGFNRNSGATKVTFVGGIGSWYVVVSTGCSWTLSVTNAVKIPSLPLRRLPGD